MFLFYQQIWICLYLYITFSSRDIPSNSDNFEWLFFLVYFYITDFQLPHLNRGQKLKTNRIAYKFLLFKAFAKPSVKSSDVEQDLYLAMGKIKNKKL